MIQSRENVSLSETYLNSYAKSDVKLDDLESALAVIERIFHIPREQIRTSDRFGVELGRRTPVVPRLDTPELEEFATELRGLLGRSRVTQSGDLGVPKIASVDDYVRLVAAARAREQ